MRWPVSRMGSPVLPSGGGGSPDADTVFRSDFGTATGTSTTALLDGSKWSAYEGNGIMSVVSASGLGFPASIANVMQVDYNSDSTFDWVYGTNIFPYPSNLGDSLYLRMYFRHAGTNAVDGPWASAHPMESEGGHSGVAGLFWDLKLGNWADGTFPFAWVIDSPSLYLSYVTNNDATHGAPAALTKNVTRRLELKFTNTGTNSFALDSRLYAGDDTTLIADRNSIYEWGGAALSTLSTAQPLDSTHLRSLRIGKNGGWGTGASGSKVYWSGFRARTADWCGPHTTLNG